jgi:hypothetical protein
MKRNPVNTGYSLVNKSSDFSVGERVILMNSVIGRGELVYGIVTGIGPCNLILVVHDWDSFENLYQKPKTETPIAWRAEFLRKA